jgi:hypothetical protein
MRDLKPLGSEKLQGMDKIKRIIEISNYGGNRNSNLEESVTTEYNLDLSDGNRYCIVKEKNGYIIKRNLSESINEYLEPLEGRRYFKSYSAALKKLNLMAKEFNTLYENESGTSLFSEQKKFFLKTPEKKNEAPSVEPTDNPPTPEPSDMPQIQNSMPTPTGMDDEEMPSPTGMDDEEIPAPTDTGDEEIPATDDEEMPTTDDEQDVTLKSIQKLVGKLTQKLRTISKKEEEMDSKDLKYVINSVLSAIDVNKLEDEDKEEIISRFDGEDEGDEGDENTDTSDFNVDDLGNDETETDIPDTTEQPKDSEIGEEIEMGSLGEKYKDFVEGQFMKGMMKTQFTPSPSQSSDGELSEEEIAAIDGVVSKMFQESKVDRVLSKYFNLSESEKIEINNKKKSLYRQINRLSESYEQEFVSKRVANKVPEIKLLGKSNKNNLVFEHNDKIYKITRRGRII